MIADRTDRQPYMYYMKTYMYYTTARETHMNFHLTCTCHVTCYIIHTSKVHVLASGMHIHVCARTSEGARAAVATCCMLRPEARPFHLHGDTIA